MGEMRRAIARENEEKQRDRFASTLVIAASIIAAVRLARDDIGTPSPKVMCAISDALPDQKPVLPVMVADQGRVNLITAVFEELTQH